MATTRCIEQSPFTCNLCKLKFDFIDVIVLFKIINEIVRELDLYLMLNHVGNFQDFHYLHNKFASLALPNESVFKSDLTAHAQEVYSLQFCKWVITYYKNL